MRSSFRLIRLFDIDIRLHITFVLFLLFFFVTLGPSGVMLLAGVFLCVTIHELCHSLAAKHFGIRVRKITLLPIGGVASMETMPKNPFQELVISLAGPMSNILILIVFYYPLKALLGQDNLMYPLMSIMGRARVQGQFSTLAYVYWLNLILAAFNLLPAFPMDGGRIVRALLSYKMSRKKATNIAVRLGHVFALIFAYVGIMHGNILLIIIAVFVYTSASGEGLQVDVSETIKDYTVRNILSGSFMPVSPGTSLGEVLEIVLHTHQEDFPVLDKGVLIGFVTKRDFVEGLHLKGKTALVADIMRKDMPVVKMSTPLYKVRALMQSRGVAAVPVVNGVKVVGVVTVHDIDRLYITSNATGERI